VLLYERGGLRCAELTWQCRPGSSERLTAYFQEHRSSTNDSAASAIYLCLVSPELDPRKSYQFRFSPTILLYDDVRLSSHWVRSEVLDSLLAPDSDFPKTNFQLSLFCGEDRREVSSVFPKRAFCGETLAAALFYVAHRDENKSDKERFLAWRGASEAKILLHPTASQTVIDTLVRTRLGEPLFATDMDLRAKRYVDNDVLDSAIMWYSAALARCPVYQLAYYRRGHLYLYLNSALKALTDFDCAVALDSTDDWAWWMRACALHLLKNHAEAIRSADRAIMLNGKEPSMRLVRSHSLRL
jgi:tetratricopeptide (TPR) repeat protein